MTRAPPWGIIAAMSYRWWILLHLVGVLGFVASHGVSMGVLFRLRSERDLARINALLDLSSRSITPMYLSFVVLLTGGIVGAFVGHLWGYGWIWGAIATLVALIGAMYAMATGYYKRVRVITEAMASGSEAVTPEQLDEVLRSSRPLAIAAIGVAGLAFILYLMTMKPTLGFAPSIEPVVAGPAIEIAAENLEFSTALLTVPVDEPFEIAFDNRDPGVPHNFSIHPTAGGALLFVGEIITGPDRIVYEVPALEHGSYLFRCDIHPPMAGNLEAGL